jgi:hypothetical protein
MPNRNTSARAAPPADGQNSFSGLLRAVVAAVVVTVSTSVCAVVPLMVTVVEARLHDAGSLAAVGEIEQLMVTGPVNPFAGVTLMVDVLLDPGFTVMPPLLLSVKLAGVPTDPVTTA